LRRLRARNHPIQQRRKTAVDFLKSIAIAASGLRAQAGRMRIISENIANADSTAPNQGADPYRRKIPTFRAEVDRVLEAQVVGLGRVKADPSEFRLKHEPGHPAADANGNVRYPNVNSLVEMTDLREAQRSYEANVNVISASRRMIQRTIEILKS
jgi:flagellar basal-body rod protein FlgC